MQVVNGLTEIINILNGQLSDVINTKWKSDDNSGTVMRLLCILCLSGIEKSDFSNVHIHTGILQSSAIMFLF
jgi:hypothetical protein